MLKNRALARVSHSRNPYNSAQNLFRIAGDQDFLLMFGNSATKLEEIEDGSPMPYGPIRFGYY
jgi:hypothetical protein